MSHCEMDTYTNVCKGCRRTQEEIENWESFSYEKRMLIMTRLGFGKRMNREERLRRYDRG